MTWQPDTEGFPPWSNDPILAQEVLYSFDGPVIFVAQVGLSKTLFVKFDEGDDTSFFHAGPIDENHLAALKAGELSLRGALTSDQIFIVELTQDLYVKRFWQDEIRLWSERFLPARRIGLVPQVKLIWDSLAEARALLALTFQGASLGRSHMPLGLLTGLVNKTHEAARRILLPPNLLSLKSASIDFHVAPPKFSSLVLALQNPVFRKEVIQKRMPGEDAPERLASEIQINGSDFVDNISELSESADKGEISLSIAQERFSSLEQIRSIVPTERNKLSELAITSNTDEKRSLVVVSHETGDKIIRARKLIEARPITDHGRIIQTNDKRYTVVYQSVRGTEVTFTMDATSFNAMEAEDSLKLGNRIRAVGYLERRTRRDSLTLTEPLQTAPAK
ncbi:hypothetical protein [Bradyrhizobium sp. 187]|uniref:hypothetical protein n=1 Tax=Bradyrhizobium sp. 187 TaxID=2782655 RepID=UPI001FFE709B|nr:hypothetical protein [Bradyrhizobium sp. 187]UPJ76163.1 hypothetical protein IVB19_17400 [Bradyrhizobium sp. 187]